MARKTKLNPKRIRQLADAIEKTGAYMETAAAYAGIAKRTFYTWLNEGRRQLDEREPDEKTGKVKRTGPFSDHETLVLAIDEALARSEIVDLQTISAHAQGFNATKTVVMKKPVKRDPKTGRWIYETTTTTTVEFKRDWQAAAWRRERKDPSRWGRRLAEVLAGAPIIAPIILPAKDPIPGKGGVNGTNRLTRSS